MDFPQQVEETLVERPVLVYEVMMESPLCFTKMEQKVINAEKKRDSHSFANLNYIYKMTSSCATLDDATLSDSGVQMMDSDASEKMVDSITSQTGLEFDNSIKCVKGIVKTQSPLLFIKRVDESTIFDNNSNVTATKTVSVATAVENFMTTSHCSTFDTTENIVYRRKVRKTNAVTKTPKKRVSFHEDILKNTRTDNIHIEHGFITYKAGIRKATQNPGDVAGRYSWCSEGDKTKTSSTHIWSDGKNIMSDSVKNEERDKNRSYVVYRNACSDVLDYGNSDVYDINQSHCLQYDNSGIFEYIPKENEAKDPGDGTKGKKDNFECSYSSSSSDSDENDKNYNCHHYGQEKSSSCDCIGSTTNNNNNCFGDNCYYSEPNIGSNEGTPSQKCVWNKEKKPKSSCLKKNHTNVINEQDLSTKLKKFNVHDMNQLLDSSSKMIFGSLKSIFTMPLLERGVPEGSEDVQSVIECIPEVDIEQSVHNKGKDKISIELSESHPIKTKPFLSKSLDGSKPQQVAKKFVHNVDEQLRHKNETELYAETRENSDEKREERKALDKHLQRQQEFDNDSDANIANTSPTTAIMASTSPTVPVDPFRNKFIINCESTVFEHRGVSYTYESSSSFNDLSTMDDSKVSMASLIKTITPVAQPEHDKLSSGFITAPLAKTFSKFFHGFKDMGKISLSQNKQQQQKHETKQNIKDLQEATDKYFATKMCNNEKTSTKQQTSINSTSTNVSKMSLSTISDVSSITNTTITSSNGNSLNQSSNLNQGATHTSYTSLTSGVGSLGSQKDSLVVDYESNPIPTEKPLRHLRSPIRKGSGTNIVAIFLKQPHVPQRYGSSTPLQSGCIPLTPDFFNICKDTDRCNSGRNSISTILSEELDDILSVTTNTGKNDSSDIIIIDYHEAGVSHYAPLLNTPLPQPTAKASLINRFLRNVTQKRVLETSIKHNNFFAQKLKTKQKLFDGHLYVKRVKPYNEELIDDLNIKIAMEIKKSCFKSPRHELTTLESEGPGGLPSFELGIGAVPVDVFLGVTLNFLLDVNEHLMRVFKLYTGYSREGFMTPVLVFLTDKTLYVTDLVRNCLCTKFILSYKDLDVILMGPYGNTVLLSNSTRDMQQVLLSGGLHSAASLVSNLELCARRNGSELPAVGQLTLDHLAPLQKFVREYSFMDKGDNWLYYAVVNIPSSSLGEISEQEPLGPHIKGFLMHRRIQGHMSCSQFQPWNPGYFLLKAGVLYMFNDSTQKIPSWAMALAQCQGARRAVKAHRPHCFEIMLKDKKLLQLAAPDEYVASEWLQALLQSASGLFEMQEKHKTLGCTLVITQNHLITLREDFSAPLKQRKKKNESNTTEGSLCNITHAKANDQNQLDDDITRFVPENNSLLSSAFSTPTRSTLRSCSSINSTPTELSQLLRSTVTTNCKTTLAFSVTNNATLSNSIISTSTTTYSKPILHVEHNKHKSVMNSVYGKNSGVEILTCARIKDIIGIKIPSHQDTWWCILEFSCQEVRVCSDDLVIFFASSTEMQRFLKLLEQLWHTKNNDLFPLAVFDKDDVIAQRSTTLYMNINRSWEPLLSAALGHPL